MTEVNLKSIKVKLDGPKVEAGYGDMMLKTNIETVKNAIVSAAGAIGLENCLKLGGAAAIATSLYVAAKSISRYFPWAKVRDVKENNVLEVSVPDKHRDRFDKSVANGKLTEKLQNDFKDLDNTLAAVLEEDEYEKVGNDVLKLIENVQVESVTLGKDKEPKAVGSILRGKLELEQENYNTFVIPKDGQSACAKIIEKDAEVKMVVKGGSEIIGSGLDGETIARITNQGLKTIVIRGKKLSKRFKDQFQSDDTIEDVIEQLKKKEKKMDNFHIFRDGEEIEKETTIQQLAQDGSLLNLRAYTESELEQQSEETKKKSNRKRKFNPL